MSTFVVSSETMNKVVRAICSMDRYRTRGRTFGPYNVDKPESWDKIGQVLFTLNIEAVQQRYPDTLDNPANMPGSDVMQATKYHFKGMPTLRDLKDKVACYKAMTCLRYQCSEGDVDKSEMYRLLSDYIVIFAERIVTDLPEYESAPWGD